MNNKFLTITTLIFGAAMLRLIPHAPNFSPIGAIALFGGAYLNRKFIAYLVPTMAMALSDLFLGFYDDGINTLCLQCDRTCLTCNGGTNNNCLTCKSNSTLFGTSCLCNSGNEFFNSKC